MIIPLPYRNRLAPKAVTGALPAPSFRRIRTTDKHERAGIYSAHVFVITKLQFLASTAGLSTRIGAPPRKASTSSTLSRWKAS
jgi:hypothetical protein